MNPQKEAYQRSLHERIKSLHFEGKCVKALNITRLFIMWEQAIFRERFYQLKKQAGIG